MSGGETAEHAMYMRIQVGHNARGEPGVSCTPRSFRLWGSPVYSILEKYHTIEWMPAVN
jgi:hypothetical protein